MRDGRRNSKSRAVITVRATDRRRGPVRPALLRGSGVEPPPHMQTAHPAECSAHRPVASHHTLSVLAGATAFNGKPFKAMNALSVKKKEE